MDLKETLGELCRDKVVYTRLALSGTERRRLVRFSRGMVSNIRGEYFSEVVLARRREIRWG